MLNQISMAVPNSFALKNLQNESSTKKEKILFGSGKSMYNPSRVLGCIDTLINDPKNLCFIRKIRGIASGEIPDKRPVTSLSYSFKKDGHIALIDDLFSRMIRRMGVHQKEGTVDYLNKKVIKKIRKLGKNIIRLVENREDVLKGNHNLKPGIEKTLDEIIQMSPGDKRQLGVKKRAAQLKESINVFLQEPYKEVKGFNEGRKLEVVRIFPFLGPFSPVIIKDVPIFKKHIFPLKPTMKPSFIKEIKPPRKTREFLKLKKKYDL